MNGDAPGARRLHPLVLIVLALLPAAVAGRAWTNPRWEWDALAYVGAAAEMRGASAEEAHARAYAELAAHAPGEVAAQLVGEGSAESAAEDPRGRRRYRRGTAENAEAFAAQLPFYRGRVLYVGALAIADAFGVSPLRAAFALSALAGAAFAALLVAWSARRLAPLPAVLAAIAATWAFDLARVAALATPDALAAALLVGGAFALVETRRRALGAALLLLAVATRADHALLAAALLGWLACFTPTERRPTRPWIAGALALVVLVAAACTLGRDTYGWWTVFHHTFERYALLPPEETPPADLAAAASRVARSLPMFRAPGPLLATLATACAWLVARRSGSRARSGASLAACAWIAALAHFALLPVLWPRLILPYWTLAWIGLAVAWRGNTAPQRNSNANATLEATAPRATAPDPPRTA